MVGSLEISTSELVVFTRYHCGNLKKKMRRAAHVACIRRTEIHAEIWRRSLKERDKLEKLVVDEKKILK